MFSAHALLYTAQMCNSFIKPYLEARIAMEKSYLGTEKSHSNETVHALLQVKQWLQGAVSGLESAINKGEAHEVTIEHMDECRKLLLGLKLVPEDLLQLIRSAGKKKH